MCMASRDVSYGTDFIVHILLCFAQNVIKTSWSDSYTEPFISEAIVCLAAQCWKDTKYGVNNESIVHHMRHCIFLSNEENCYLLIIQELRFVKSKKAQRVDIILILSSKLLCFAWWTSIKSQGRGDVQTTSPQPQALVADEGPHD